MTYGFGEYLKDVAFVLLLALSFAGGYLFDNTMSLDNIDYKSIYQNLFVRRDIGYRANGYLLFKSK